MVDTVYYEDNLKEFLSDYYYDNADMMYDIDFDTLETYVLEIFYKWKSLVKAGEDEWVAARIAYNDYEGLLQ